MADSIIVQKYDHYQTMRQILLDNGEVSDAVELEDIFIRVLIVSSASQFEKEISDALCTFVTNASRNNAYLVSFLKNKAIARQYHSYFDWTGNNTNHFWSLFGGEVKKVIKEELDSNASLKEAERAFLSLGNKRNLLVHNDFITFCMQDSVNDVMQEYHSAKKFINYLTSKLDGWCSNE